MALKCPKCHSENPDTKQFCGDCGTKLSSSAEAFVSFTKTLQISGKGLSPGSTFALRYKIVDELGRGGMGVVYKAEDIKLKRTVALKFLPPELTGATEAKERFIREAQAAAVLDHPNICTIYEADEAEDQTFISMAYVEGESLSERIKRGPLKVKEGLYLAIQAAEGIAAAHRKGIVHRDIKSANIMVDKHGRAMIMDFGLAKFAGASLITREGVTMGTVAYMSPEQAQGKAVDHRSDIWSLGVVLYEMFSGQLPFQGETEASFLYSIVNKDPAPLKEINPVVPIEIQKIISRALKKKPDSRYQSAEEMLADLKQYLEQLKAEEAGVFNLRSLLRRLRQPRVAVPSALALAAIIAAVVWFVDRQAKIRWAENVALPEIESLIEDMSYNPNSVQAFELAVKAEKYIPDNPKLLELLAICSGEINVVTDPPGADIYIKEYKSPESDWEFIGVSPIREQRLPYQFYRIKIEKEGYEPVQYVTPTFDWVEKGVVPWTIERTLDKRGTVPPGMIRVKGRWELPDYFIDIHEVTNLQFKEFVDAGGYQKREYWKQEFIKDGKGLTWEEAMAEFVDQTGRPGPALWEAGVYETGQDDYPVAGVSWYEAAAYAEFADKSLPTIVHWSAAIVHNNNTDKAINHAFIPFSNFRGEGPEPVGSNHSLIFSGAYDMAGNVREWCWNQYQKGRCIRGGAWNDAIYMFRALTQSPPFDRSEKNGFRCVRYIDKEQIPAGNFQAVQRREDRDFYKEEPVSDDIFQVYKEQFSYDAQELNPIIETREESSDWVREKISFDAAYGGERVIVYLYLPKNASPPYQTVILFPGSEAVMMRDNEDLLKQNIFKYGFIVKNKRAFLNPIYKGTGERTFDGALGLHGGRETREYTEFLIQVVKDFKRSIDYLETREDTDSQRVAFLGYSWGGFLGSIIPAVEERLKASILELGGFVLRPRRPEAYELNYVTRVKIPTLMLNGKYDVTSFPLETRVRPMFDLLGVPGEHKRLVVCESDHFIPRTELIKEILSWLDKYLGPVK